MVDVGVGKAPLVRPSLPVAGMEEYVFLRSGSQSFLRSALNLFPRWALYMFPDVRPSIHF